ncbi:hypothetical protein ACA910_012218 [Epithemia clementina (nom. ined.)]
MVAASLDEGEDWIKLDTGKDFSRLLYTNPVCFLYVGENAFGSDRKATQSYDNNSGSSFFVASGEGGAVSTTQQGISNVSSAAPPANLSSSIEKPIAIEVLRERRVVAANETTHLPLCDASDGARQRRNVQVLSWLTATNNEGSFVFSINHRRHTASFLLMQNQHDDGVLSNNNQKDERFFSLSVPVQGMEQLLLDVGSCSGRFGSKFPSDHTDNVTSKQSFDLPETASSSAEEQDQEHAAGAMAASEATPTSSTTNAQEGRSPNISGTRNRQRKQPPKTRFPIGIPGLELVRVGSIAAAPNQTTPRTDHHFAGIEGCVAHLYCRVLQCIAHPTISPNHYKDSRECATKLNPDRPQQHSLVLAQVETAYVHSHYWDGQKKLFRPQNQHVPPYLTFFGSQTFGYVQSEPHLQCIKELIPQSVPVNAEKE